MVAGLTFFWLIMPLSALQRPSSSRSTLSRRIFLPVSS